MKKLIRTLLITLTLAASSSCNPSDGFVAGEWVDLIDPELSQWDQYLSYQHQKGYNGDIPKDQNGVEIPPLGMNPEGYEVFTTIRDGEQTIIRVSGEYYGALISKCEYRNYHLQLKYKWGDLKWGIRGDKLKDSGILYHSIGEPGAEYWRSWMVSQEFQIMEGHTGDYWSQLSSAIDIKAYRSEGNLDPLAHAEQGYLTLQKGGAHGNYCMRSNNYESSAEEWTTLDLYCYEGRSLHMVNGEVVMILRNSSNIDPQGKRQPLTEGKIQLQSEAAELFFKDIRIREVESLSHAQMALF